MENYLEYLAYVTYSQLLASPFFVFQYLCAWVGLLGEERTHPGTLSCVEIVWIIAHCSGEIKMLWYAHLNTLKLLYLYSSEFSLVSSKCIPAPSAKTWMNFALSSSLCLLHFINVLWLSLYGPQDVSKSLKGKAWTLTSQCSIPLPSSVRRG